jgi:hypothetical protein
MNAKPILFDSDIEYLTAYLTGASPAVEEIVIHADLQDTTIRLDDFLFFRGDISGHFSLKLQWNYLVLLIGAISGQSSKVGIYDLAAKNWMVKESLDFYEAVAACIDKTNKRAYLGCWVYRHTKPPSYFANCLDLEPPHAIQTLKLLQTIPSNSDQPEITLDPTRGVAEFNWSGNKHIFSLKT